MNETTSLRSHLKNCDIQYIDLTERRKGAQNQSTSYQLATLMQRKERLKNKLTDRYLGAFAGNLR